MFGYVSAWPMYALFSPEVEMGRQAGKGVGGGKEGGGEVGSGPISEADGRSKTGGGWGGEWGGWATLSEPDWEVLAPGQSPLSEELSDEPNRARYFASNPSGMPNDKGFVEAKKFMNS